MMNTHKMHGTVSTFVFIAVLAGSVMASSCSLFFIDKDHSSSGGAGSLSVSLVYEDAMARTDGSISSRNDRTVVPSLEANAKAYVVSCSDASGKEVASVVITSLDSCVLKNLPAGSFTVTARAYSDATVHTSDRLIAQGSANVNLVQDGSAAVSIVLSYLNTETGSGNLSFSVQWPDFAADSIKWYLDGNASAEPSIEYGNPSVGMRSAKLDKSGLSSGSHYLIIEFFLGTTHVGYAYEAVYICDNATSSHVVQNGSLVSVRTFTEAEIASTGTGSSILVMAGGNSSIIALNDSGVPSSYNAALSTTVTIVPLVGEIGQAMMYSWNGSSSISCISGVPLSLPMNANVVDDFTSENRANTLILDVSSPSGGSPVKYSITMRSPIRVKTATALAGALSAKNNELLNNNVILEDDIMLTGTGNWTPVGSIGPDPSRVYVDQSFMFTGTFDGGGHTISGLNLTTTNGDAGFFAAIGKGAYITGVRLTNVSITGGGTDDGIGGLVGENYGGTITRCSVSGYVTGHHGVGGLVGNNRAESTYDFQSRISECYSTATVTSTSTIAGGLVGSNWGIVENSYARSNVSAQNTAGGLVASQASTGSIANCYASGTVTASTNSGGLVGAKDEGGLVSGSYYNQPLSGLSDTDRGTPKSVDEMRNATAFSAWDKSIVWAINSAINSGFPYLLSIMPTSDVSLNAGTVTADEFLDSLSDLSADYVLNGDITISTPWTPVGSVDLPFTGTFNGNGHTISGLNVSLEIQNVGLFGVNNGIIENVKLENPSVITTNDYSGGLAGQNNGLIRRCSVIGLKPVKAMGRLGGLVGKNTGTITESYTSIPVEATSWYVGGLVGTNGGTIIDCYATGSVTSLNGKQIGGLIGDVWSSCIVKNSYATGKVSGVDDTGGLVGVSGSSLINCFYNTTTSGMSDTGKGEPKTTADMKDSGAFTGWDFVTVWEIDTDNSNGLFNDGYPYLNALGAQNTITLPSGDMYAETLSGAMSDHSAKYTLSGDITLLDDWTPLGSGADPFTGIFNGNGFTISGLTVDYNESSAGLFGINNGTIENVNIENASIKSSSDSCGILAGQNNGVIRHCSVSGSSPVQGVIYVGGLVGINRGLISESYSTVPVLASSFSVGGLVGRNENFISNCYATGSVTSTRENVGGLVGHTWKNPGTNIIPVVEKSFAIGKVTGSANTGGLVGYNENSIISKSFYNATTTGMSDTDKGTPKTTTEMLDPSTFTGATWDIDSGLNNSKIWGIDTTGAINNGHPYLQCFGSDTRSPPFLGGYLNGNELAFTKSAGITLIPNRNGVPNAAYQTTADQKLLTTDSSVLFTGENDFTIMGWFKITSVDVGYTYLFYKSGSGVSNYGVILSKNSESPWKFIAQITQQGGSGVSIANPPDIQFDTWCHVAMVYKNKTVSQFVNGVQVGNTTGAYSGATGPGSEFYFGAFNGAMSDLKIFNTAKSQAEIQTLMDP
ncbi:LamG domain-containing protein [Treponema zuelzerae]|uniref:LamG domain-containing protein n=1 Tax=Teretinema zuelzerae TaxID=156 RepID=A0AAE3EH40_9SPIR|nr:LamG domain-containing protein [Teretinema zuelzerae]MCD1653404.1 LamG domain-containing protein [Teretinema zuelzerae]